MKCDQKYLCFVRHKFSNPVPAIASRLWYLTQCRLQLFLLYLGPCWLCHHRRRWVTGTISTTGSQHRLGYHQSAFGRLGCRLRSMSNRQQGRSPWKFVILSCGIVEDRDGWNRKSGGGDTLLWWTYRPSYVWLNLPWHLGHLSSTTEQNSVHYITNKFKASIFMVKVRQGLDQWSTRLKPKTSLCGQDQWSSRPRQLSKKVKQVWQFYTMQLHFKSQLDLIQTTNEP